MTNTARVSRWARAFVLAGVGWLFLWQVGVLAGISHRTGVVVGLLGFVFHTVFGKTYSLVPSYFDTELATTRLLPVHFAGAVGGTGLFAIGVERSHGVATTLGASLWFGAILLFLGTMGMTIRGNLTGSRTGTGGANIQRQPLDRLANLFVPVVFLYLLVGSYALLALETGLPTVFDGYPPRSSHLLGAGTGALLVFTIGFRLLPRFFVAEVPSFLPRVVLPAGAVGPLVLAASLPSGNLFVVGALLEAVAVFAFAAAIGVLFVRTDRDRVGFYGVLAGALAGTLAALFGLVFAFDGVTVARVTAHVRLNLLGFLGLTIVGVSYQFYPPTVGSFPFASDRTAVTAICLLGAALALEVGGALSASDALITAGHLLAVAGATVHGYLLTGVFLERGFS